MIKEKVSAQVIVRSLEKQAAPLIKKLNNFKIKSNEDYEDAVTLTRELKELSKEATRQFDTIVSPLKSAIKLTQQSVKATQIVFKPFQDQVVLIDQTIKAQMLEYQQRLDEKKVKLNADFESGKVVKVNTFIKKSVELEVDTSVRKVWKAICVDVKKTPNEYMIPDEDRIKEDLKAGKKIAGWKWKQVKTIAI